MSNSSSVVPPSSPAALVAESSLTAAAMRVLQRTAHSLASSPGGLRFVAGSRPWLPGSPRALALSPSPFPLLNHSA